MNEAQRILVTGGTGFIGKRLIGALVAHGRQVSVVTRTPDAQRSARAGVEYVPWLPDLARFQAVIHLAGESIHGKRWTPELKEQIRASRVDSTRKLVDALGASARKPKVFLCASAVGYYGERGDEELRESAPAGSGFLAKVCAAWETEAARATQLGVRTVELRLGAVLAPGGGALKELVPIFRLGLGGPIGSGRAWFPWVHADDVGAAILFALENELVNGPVNLVGPTPARNSEFSASLGRVLRRPAFLPVPPFAVKLRYGEVASAILASQRVVPQKLLELGFAFRFATIEAALADLLG